MEELIIILSKKLSKYSLGDIDILLDHRNLIQWETLQAIKQAIVSNRDLSNDDIIHLYYARYLQTLFATDDPIPEAYMHGITLLIDLKKCIRDYSLENCITIITRKIGNSIKLSLGIELISKLVKEIKRAKTELAIDDLRDIENDIYLGIKSWIVQKRPDFNVWTLRECYNNVDSILAESTIKQKINDLVAVKVYAWFLKTYSGLIRGNLSQNFMNALDGDEKRISNWMSSINCRHDINEKIENFEPIIGKIDLYDKDPSSIYRVTTKSQLDNQYSNSQYLASVKKRSYRLAVYKSKIIDTGEIVVVKSFISDVRENLQNGYNEKDIYEKLAMKNTDFTLKYYGHFLSTKKKNTQVQYKLNLVLEYCDSTLFDEIVRLKMQDRTYQNREIAQIIYTLLDLFRKLRKEKVNHCDIKPQNIFITSDGRLKLGDFDLSETFKTSDASNLGTKLREFLGGTVNYMAPELKEIYRSWEVNGNPCDKRKFSKERSDVYSLGLVFLMVITLRPVGGFNEHAHQDELRQIIENLQMDWAKRLLRRMLAYLDEERPRFEEAFEMLEEDPEFILCLNSSD
ncbi:unnamed protein product [Blepharisma stoltei]|uniref:Protein kinase domain-containing protein n=1 Tax=Blepharisma stoltei TaxID=1481888 RepID=A0AAU9K4S7_9CILI|nr:unnamed protein product [Blepharisma stoltei]